MTNGYLKLNFSVFFQSQENLCQLNRRYILKAPTSKFSRRNSAGVLIEIHCCHMKELKKIESLLCHFPFLFFKFPLFVLPPLLCRLSLFNMHMYVNSLLCLLKFLEFPYSRCLHWLVLPLWFKTLRCFVQINKWKKPPKNNQIFGSITCCYSEMRHLICTTNSCSVLYIRGEKAENRCDFLWAIREKSAQQTGWKTE